MGGRARRVKKILSNTPAQQKRDRSRRRPRARGRVEKTGKKEVGQFRDSLEVSRSFGPRRGRTRPGKGVKDGSVDHDHTDASSSNAVCPGPEPKHRKWQGITRKAEMVLLEGVNKALDGLCAFKGPVAVRGEGGHQKKRCRSIFF